MTDHDRRPLQRATADSAIMFLLLSVPAAASVIQFQCDGGEQEQKYLVAAQTFIKQVAEWRPGVHVRNLDGNDTFVIWRFNVTGAPGARFSIDKINKFIMSVSTDGHEHVEIARRRERGGKSWQTFDLSQWLPARWLYVKFTHHDLAVSAPQRPVDSERLLSVVSPWSRAR